MVYSKTIEQQQKEDLLRKIIDFCMKWGTILVTVLVFIFFTFATWDSEYNESLFLTTDNMITILRSISIMSIIAIGLTFSLAVNGMDLSVGSTANLADTFVMTMFVWYGLSVGMSIALTIAVCLLVTLVNVFLIIKMKIPDMIATLAVMFMLQGVALTYSNGGAITERMMLPDGTQAPGLVPPFFREFGIEPYLIIIMVLVVGFAWFFLNFTKYGRFMYAIGGNPEAAKLSGIPVNRYKFLAYLLSTIFATVGGICLAARVGTAQVGAGDTFLMPAVAAAFIGYSIAGAGKPNAIGTLIGAVLIGILENGLIMMAVPYYAMNIIKGLVLAGALALTYSTKK